MDTLDTFENSKGIIAITTDPKINLLAYPDKASGYVKLKNYDLSQTILMNAHDTKIVCLSLSRDGRILATASEKGTTIRIFSTDDGAYLSEFRRGKDFAEVYSISFDPLNKFLSCSCSTGTIHIFNLTGAYEKQIELLKGK